MSPRDRWLIAACYTGFVAAILWTLVYAAQAALILSDGALFGLSSGPPASPGERWHACAHVIPGTVLGVVMTIICVRVPERIRRRYRTMAAGFQVRPRR
jgi:hypothetical protein